MYRLLVFAILFASWLGFSGLFDAFHVTLGLLAAAFVTWISSDLFFENRRQTGRERLRQLAALPPYLVWLFRQIVVANLHILRLVLLPKGMDDVAPRVVAYKTRLQSPFARFTLAQSITLTPGTVTLKVVGDTFYVHAISKWAADGLDGDMEERIAAVYEPELIEASRPEN